ncbi:hypothetical protein JCM19538_2916 [Jejuia pallidilutea]|uniref:Uncharacterized protein n=1 Tax=Jejuia pallidilutea TaxID=504487 RepID=A0A098LQH2_9FLAO|nr:hypothetical protein JCM19538_2916 [Jejuia pallidilutea]
MPIIPRKEAISKGVLLFIANQAGIAKNVIPSGMPCAMYSAENEK